MPQEHTGKRILLVEDDKDLAELTSQYLVRNGFEVLIVNDGLLAVQRILEDVPDLVILDLMLPKLDGLEVCKKVRQVFSNPILMFTACNDNIDEILGLEIGADDYITKPAEPRLLLARIKVLFRRSLATPVSQVENKVIIVNDLKVNDSSRTVLLKNEEVILSNTEYELLWLLVSEAGKILSREFIFENLRGLDYDGCNRTIDITISRIRSKLGDSSTFPKIIKTIRNKGYLLSM
jgi:two-component system response regulator RstA